MINYWVSVAQGAPHVFLFPVSLFTFVSPTYRVHSSSGVASALSSSMAVQHKMQRLSDFKLSPIQVLVFGHGSGHDIHILCPEMKEELV